MAKRDTYTVFFDTEDAAETRCAIKNRGAKLAGNYRDVYCVVDGPDDNYAVVDLTTAIDLGNGYKICD